jgi:hypothetical protein
VDYGALKTFSTSSPRRLVPLTVLLPGGDRDGKLRAGRQLERLAGSYDSDCDRVRQDHSIAEAHLRDYGGRLGKPFLHDAYLAVGRRLQYYAGSETGGKPKSPARSRGWL